VYRYACPALCLFHRLSIVYTIYLSFFEWNGMAPTKTFVGLANYQYMFGDKYFYISLTNNLKWLASRSRSRSSWISYRLCDAREGRFISRPCAHAIFFPVTMSLVASA